MPSVLCDGRMPERTTLSMTGITSCASRPVAASPLVSAKIGGAKKLVND